MSGSQSDHPQHDLGGNNPQDNRGEVVDTGVGVEPDLSSGLQRLWAPYRSAYLTERPTVADDASAGDKSADSESASKADPFLELPKQRDEDALIVARGKHVFCVLNLYPYNPGHMMVIPYRQVADYADLTEAEVLELAKFTQHALRVLRAVSGPDAINVGMNLGSASGGSIPHHLHQHVVPRWTGDTSFMTVIAGTKVLPQTLKDTRALLSRAWKELNS